MKFEWIKAGLIFLLELHYIILRRDSGGAGEGVAAEDGDLNNTNVELSLEVETDSLTKWVVSVRV